jgi:predicted permease
MTREVEAHLTLIEDDLRRRGLSAEEARLAACRTFGGVDSAKELHRSERSFQWIEDALQDLRYGLRSLIRNRAFTAATIVTLALGLGVNVAVFSLVYGVLLRPLPYANGDRLVVLHQQATRMNALNVSFSVKEIEDYRASSHTLDHVVEHHSMDFLLYTGDAAERVHTAVVSANFFDALGARALYGRTFVASDDAPDSDAVLILSHAYWQRRFGGDPAIVGKLFEMNDRPHRVIGVLPPLPQYPVETDVYMPTSHCPFRSAPDFIANRQSRMMTAFGVLEPGATLQEAQSDLSVIATQLEQSYPEVYRPEFGYGMKVTSLADDLTSRADLTFLLLLSAAGFVLLIACANVANLLLARLMNVKRELALRMAIGASRGRLIRQLLAESVLLSTVAGVLGVAAAPLALQTLTSFAARFTTRAAEIKLDEPVLLFGFALSVATGLVFGLGPALALSRNPAAAVREGETRSTGGRTPRVFRNGLVVAQVAVSLILLTGAGLMIRSFANLQSAEAGFQPDHLLTVRVTQDFTRYPDTPARIRLSDRLLPEVRALSSVVTAAVATSFPFNREGITNGPATARLEVEGSPESLKSPVVVDAMFVGTGYFETLGQHAVEGRTFTDFDKIDRPPIAVINETMARQLWPTESAIGKRFRRGTGPWTEVVGVVKDVREYGLQRPVRGQVYLAVAQTAGFAQNMIVRTKADPEAIIPTLRETIRKVDPLLAVDRFETMEVLRDASMASSLDMTTLLGLMAALALLISCTGIAAVMALAVNERTSELGIRMALGASRATILKTVTLSGFFLALAGVVIGVAASIGVTRWLSSLLFETSPTDPLTFAATAGLFLAVAAIACLVPARRVTSIDPLQALRRE